MESVDVLVQVETETFRAKVQLDVEVDSLGKNVPDRLSGIFTTLPSGHPAGEHANFLLHSEPSGGGSSHKIWLGGHEYKFIMTSSTALDFTAVSSSVNPLTGRRGVKKNGR